MKIKILSTLTAVVLASSMMTSGIFAVEAETETPDVLILGDSISTGYGLDEGTQSYGEIVADYIDANYSNLSVNGDTSADLLSLLTEDETVIDAVTEAEIICISIGGNDMLGTLMTALSQYMEEGDTWLDAKDKILADQTAVAALNANLSQDLTTAVSNIVLISQAIDTLNIDAEVIFQTVYNPFEIYTVSGNALADLHSFTNIYLGALNTGIKSLYSATIVDTYSNFKGYGWLFTNITSQDIHPNKLGHMEIASQYISVLEDVSFESVFGSMLNTLSAEELALIPSDILDELIPVETTVTTDVTSDVTSDIATDETSDVATDETSDVATDETSDVATDETSDVTTDVTTTVSETTYPTDTTPEDFVALYGDVDLDGEVRILDIVVFNKHIVGTVALDASQRENADCLHDGFLNMSDNLMIASFLCKKIDVLGPDAQPVETDVTETTIEDVTETTIED
ncbi:MAG TPA: hypothetical protein GX710_02120, partial [Clostridiales bacterium]|nr:hypothetical protein [Clostridiales bacterium]